MVTQEQMKQFKLNDNVASGTAYAVTPEDMVRFESADLPYMIADRKLRYDKEKGLKPTAAYEQMEEDCQISITSLKKTMSGTQKITRTFLYKLSVGLHMTVDEANEFFRRCGGVLKEDHPGDFICLRALLDGDTIYEFIEQYELYMNERIGLRERRW